MKSSFPLPDLDDFMQIEQVKYLYGTIDIEAIHKSCYTAKQHKKFMETFGCLVQDIKIE